MHNMIFAIAIIFIKIILQDTYVGCIECFACTDVLSMAECKQLITCPLDARCYKGVVVIGGLTKYTLGCTKTSSCPVMPTNSSLQQNIDGALVGRSALGRQNCSDCCRFSNCNKQLCQSYDPSCADTADYDCTAIGSTIDICSDTRHAKKFCRKFCGLCSLVDGGWAEWSKWSYCDVSCGHGTRIRTRACTDPVPADGGDNCIGMNQDTQTCSMATCPVHGGWTEWLQWVGCSSACDIGMQRRSRSCSNPYPSLNGNHCFGESRDDRLCFPGACADGGWSAWEQWNGCSRSCDFGLRSRARKCDNPVRSITGKDCTGDASQTELCNMQACRSSNACYVKSSAFTAKEPTGNGSPLIFSLITLNEGNNYNPANGLFTCEHPGLYYFTVDLTKKRDYSHQVDVINCEIRKNGNTISHIRIDPFDGDVDKGSYEATGSAVLQLVKDDVVSIVGRSAGELEPWSTFSGFLFFPDA